MRKWKHTMAQVDQGQVETRETNRILFRFRSGTGPIPKRLIR